MKETNTAAFDKVVRLTDFTTDAEKDALAKELGLSFLPIVSGREEIAIRGGIGYARYGTDSTFRALGDRDDLPVLCPCGNDAFTIRYGEYSCLGKCTACGEEYELYSG